MGGEYGVSDYRDVKQELGSLADWTSLVEATKARDIKVGMCQSNLVEPEFYFENTNSIGNESETG